MGIFIQIVILSIVFGIEDSKIEANDSRKRFYRFIAGVEYAVIGVAAYYLYLNNILRDTIWFSAVVGIFASVGCFLSAINTNLREMYGSTLFCGVIEWLLYHFLSENHPVAMIMIGGIILLGWFGMVQESISNIRRGIDPDEVEKQKRLRRKIFSRIFFAIYKGIK